MGRRSSSAEPGCLWWRLRAGASSARRRAGHRDLSTTDNRPPSVFGRGNDRRGARSVSIHAKNSGMSLSELCCLEKMLVMFRGFETDRPFVAPDGVSRRVETTGCPGAGVPDLRRGAGWGRPGEELSGFPLKLGPRGGGKTRLRLVCLSLSLGDKRML